MLVFVAVTVRFTQPLYYISENDGSAQVELVLSKPLSYYLSFIIIGLSTGKYNITL